MMIREVNNSFSILIVSRRTATIFIWNTKYESNVLKNKYQNTLQWYITVMQLFLTWTCSRDDILNQFVSWIQNLSLSGKVAISKLYNQALKFAQKYFYLWFSVSHSIQFNTTYRLGSALELWKWWILIMVYRPTCNDGLFSLKPTDVILNENTSKL